MRIFIFLHGAEKETFLKLKPLVDEPIICADSGIRLAMKLPYKPKSLLLVGDLDSVSSKEINWCKKNNFSIKVYPENKDFTDGELALQYACSEYKEETPKIILGGISTLMDHTLGNILSVVPYVESGHNLSFSLKNQNISIIKKNLVINNCKGHIISLIPIVPSHILSTKGLQWKLEKEKIYPYSSRTLRNKATEKTIQIELKEGLLIVVESW